MAALVAAIHVLLAERKSWMAGARPAMTRKSWRSKSQLSAHPPYGAIVAVRKAVSSPASRRDPLKDYAQKRDFSRTSEPKPERAKSKDWQFVVQKHDARRVHYDLRLELNGTLKSWAVTKGPSLIAGEKRLAVRTEDHPMQYLDFECNIPKGEYGVGAMIVWVRGRWVTSIDTVK